MADIASKMKVSITFDQISIKDHAVPTRHEMVHILNRIDLCIKYDKPVYLHCLGGRGRTGTVVGCYLIRHGLATGKNVTDKIKELRRNVINWYSPSPETQEQVEMVVNWENGL
jgi:protein-tyrosine phosphatase